MVMVDEQSIGRVGNNANPFWISVSHGLDIWIEQLSFCTSVVGVNSIRTPYLLVIV